MRSSFIAALSLALAATLLSTPAPADDAQAAAVKGVVQHYFDALRKGDLATMSADWESSGTVVDGFAPFIWNGRGALQNWWHAVRASFKAFGLEKIDPTIEDWQRITIQGDRAFAVAAASSSLSGPSLELSAKGTTAFILHREGGVWRITSWSWAGPAPVPGNHTKRLPNG